MPRTASLWTIDAAGKYTLVCDPNVPLIQQKAKYRALGADNKDGNDKVVEAQFVEHSRIYRRRWKSKAQLDAIAAAKAKEEQLARDAAKAIEKEKAETAKAKADAQKKYVEESDRKLKERQDRYKPADEKVTK